MSLETPSKYSKNTKKPVDAPRKNCRRMRLKGATPNPVRGSSVPCTVSFGPKFRGSGPVRLFFTGEIGFDNFSISNQNATAGFTNTVGPTSGSTFFVVYPGGGIEAFAGPIGLRAEIGDDIYSTMSLTII
jgi:hypothetical protein